MNKDIYKIIIDDYDNNDNYNDTTYKIGNSNDDNTYINKDNNKIIIR